MRSVEFTFDEPTDAAVRSWWTTLTDEGLPSLALHDSPSNRPHVTLVAGPALCPTPRLQSVARSRPAAVTFGGLVRFPAARGRFVLARSVVVDPALAAFQAAVHDAVEADAEEHTSPSEWTPHVTIARRLLPADWERAAAILDGVEVPPSAVVQGVRFWDGDARVVTALG
ncbi:2'-5' RNA ligase family protein [Curtobacterium sp. RRHDQ10]|uniref:2'-5' RNA ligase family protein n=1 Tax=Curtobacterium phyllosphaerae TaxID=3413379 RepID=UPI003BF3D4F0